MNNTLYARDCDFCHINEDTAFEFFLKNHIENPISSGDNFGLIHKGELVACICIGKARFNLDGFEIYRFATKNFTTVVGGLSKIIKNVLKLKKIGKLFSYINLRIFDGKGLESIGFKPVRVTKPDYFYTKDFVNLIPRERFMMSKTGIDENIFARENGYSKIFGVGHRLYVLEI